MPFNRSPLEKIVRVFTWMAICGSAVVVAGIAVGAFLEGATRVTVICGAIGCGGLMVWAGLRERERGNKILERHPQ